MYFYLIVGFSFYLSVFIAFFLSSSVHSMVIQSVELAMILSFFMGGVYLYPMIVFFAKWRERGDFFISQIKLSASVVVSLGLIGTFQGLTGMVTSISSSLSGGGDMLSGIVGALGSMGYAFLTSINGVALSVLLLISGNFLFKFKRELSSALLKDEEKIGPPSINDVIAVNANLIASIEHSINESKYFLMNKNDFESFLLNVDAKVARSDGDMLMIAENVKVVASVALELVDVNNKLLNELISMRSSCSLVYDEVLKLRGMNESMKVMAESDADFKHKLRRAISLFAEEV